MEVDEDEDESESEDEEEETSYSSPSEDTGDDRAEFHEYCKPFTDKLDYTIANIEIVTDRKLGRREFIDHLFNAMLQKSLRPPPSLPTPKTENQLMKEQLESEGYARGTAGWKRRLEQLQLEAEHRAIEESVVQQLKDEGVVDEDAWEKRYYQMLDRRLERLEEAKAESAAAREVLLAEQQEQLAARAAIERAAALAEAARVAAQPRAARTVRPDYFEDGSDDAGDDDEFVGSDDEEEEEDEEDDEEDEDYGGRPRGRRAAQQPRRAAQQPRRAAPQSRRAARAPTVAEPIGMFDDEPIGMFDDEPIGMFDDEPPPRLMRAVNAARFGRVERTERPDADPRPPTNATRDEALKWMLQNLEPAEWTDLQMVDYVQDPANGLRPYPTSSPPINQLRERLYTKLRDPGLVDQEYEGDTYTGRYRWHYDGQNMAGWERGHA